MGDLSDEELDSIERSLGGPQLVATSKSETCRMLAELKRHRAAMDAGGCPVHDGAVHGGEAEELRKGIETLISGIANVHGMVRPTDLQRLLDSVNARDSLAHLERQDAQTASADRVREVVREAIVDAATKSVDAALGEVCRQVGDMGRVITEARGAGLAASLADVVTSRVAAQLTTPSVVSAADRAEIEQWLVGRAQDGYACEALDRLLHALDAAPPGHVCPVPYGLGPEEIDVLVDLSRMFRESGGDRTSALLDRILAMHRPPGARS